MSVIDRARSGFAQHFGCEPQGVAFAPGRVNLIGEHVDYSGGLALPMPIAAGTAIAWGDAGDPAIAAVALDLDEATDRFLPEQLAVCNPPDWRSYLRGMVAELRARGHQFGGSQLAITGSIPQGSGLSSSASLCVALGRALLASHHAATPAARDLALAAQATEHTWAQVRCGIMDQMAIAAGEAGKALLLDCRTLETSTIALPQDWAVMIVQSGVVRGLVDGHYNARRADCEAAVAALGVAALRDADAEQVRAAALDPIVARRALHVVEEIARVEAAVSAIRQADLPKFGDLLRASHASLRDLFEVSVARVDALVSALNAAIGSEGGARMTGGGFGGAAVAVLPIGEVARVRAEVERNYAPPGGERLSIMIEGVSGELSGRNHELD